MKALGGQGAVLIVIVEAHEHCTPLNRIIALDPATGVEAWSFDPHAGLISEERRAKNCRGVAYWQSETETGVACSKRVFKGDGWGHVFAVDGDTGDLHDAIIAFASPLP